MGRSIFIYRHNTQIDKPISNDCVDVYILCLAVPNVMN